jgi:hypothetical protein
MLRELFMYSFSFLKHLGAESSPSFQAILYFGFVATGTKLTLLERGKNCVGWDDSIRVVWAGLVLIPRYKFQLLYFSENFGEGIAGSGSGSECSTRKLNRDDPNLGGGGVGPKMGT